MLTFADLFPSDKTKVTMMLLVMMMTMMMMMMMMNKDIEIQRSIGNCVQYSAATRPATLNEFAVAAFRCLVLFCITWSPQNIHLILNVTQVVHRFGHTMVPNKSTLFSVTCPRLILIFYTIKIYCLINTEGAHRIPMTYDNHPIHPIHTSHTIASVRHKAS